MVKQFNIENDKIVENVKDRPDILIYVNPDEIEKKKLVDQLKLDEHTLNSSLDPDELSRLEFEADHIAIIIKRPQNYLSKKEPFLFSVSSFGIFWFKTQLIILMNEDVPMFDGKIFNKVKNIEDVVLKVIYKNISHYVEHLKAINMISDSLEKKINSSMENRYLIELFKLEKSLVYYLNAINSNAIVIEKIKSNAVKIGLTQESVELVDDLIIENNQSYKQAEIYSNILAGLMDARVSIVSNNLNSLMKTLNVITIGIMVPTLVVSAFSMNVKIPLSSHKYAFWIIMALATMSVFLFYFIWRRRK